MSRTLSKPSINFLSLIGIYFYFSTLGKKKNTTLSFDWSLNIVESKAGWKRYARKLEEVVNYLPVNTINYRIKEKTKKKKLLIIFTFGGNHKIKLSKGHKGTMLSDLNEIIVALCAEQ